VIFSSWRIIIGNMIANASTIGRTIWARKNTAPSTPATIVKRCLDAADR